VRHYTWAEYVAFTLVMIVVAGVFVTIAIDICDRRRWRPPNTLGQKRKRPSNR
jgi:hypothetical protein